MASDGSGLNRFRDAEDARKRALLQVEAGRRLARQGALQAARRLFRQAVEIDPSCTPAWLQLAWVTQETRERKALLRRVLALEPEHAQAAAELARLRRLREGEAAQGPSRKWHLRPWVWATLIIMALLFLGAALIWGPVDSSLARLLPTAVPTPSPTPTRTPAQIADQFLPQLEEAVAAEAWGRALEIVAIMVGVDPAGEEVRQRALATRLQYGQSLVEAGEMAQALVQFDEAASIVPDDAQALLWRDTTRDYLAGVEALVLSDWPTAVQTFVRAYERFPDYGDLAERLAETYRRQGEAAIEEEAWDAAITSLSEGHERFPDDASLAGLLATAYRERGILWQQDGKLKKAQADLEAALALRPDDAEAQAHLDKVMYILFPPKRIEIDISKQRFYAWEGDTLVYNFPTSTGLRGRDTATGRFKVLDKIPMAYSSIWRLKMPYWLGIYYVGRIENGIHALPIRPDGSVMWGGLLGQRASYGCVILSTKAAEIIYNWAEIGTEVHIHN
ncbi:MAG: L,D-transpeptidase family protein [Anaerolineae bacterium]|nr:L,D-transpeptidase family protein [Anaerolineae bacterium]